MAGRRKIFVWTFALLSAGGAAAYFGVVKPKVDTPPETSTTVKVAAPKVVEPIAVTTARITLQPVERTVSIVGNLRGFDEIEISTIVDGRVNRIFHDVGDVVHPGEQLLEIDDTDYRLAVDEMTRSLELELSRLGLKELPDENFDVGALPTVLKAMIVERNMANTLERYRKLVSQNAITKDDFEKAELNVQTAQLDVKQAIIEAEQTLASVRHRAAVLETAKKKVQDVKVTVPAATVLAGGPREQISLVSTAPSSPSGNSNAPRSASNLKVPGLIGAATVSERLVSEGEIVRASQPTKLFRLIVEDPLKLQAAVPERYAGRVQVGQPVKVSVEAFPDRMFTGSVARVNPTVEESSRTFAVEVAIPNPERLLKAGSFATGNISFGREERTWTVPEEAVVKFAGVSKIFVVDGDRVRELPIEVGTRIGASQGDADSHWIEVRGVPANGGDVVTAGHSQLSVGSPVRVRNVEAAARSPKFDSKKEVR